MLAVRRVLKIDGMRRKDFHWQAVGSAGIMAAMDSKKYIYWQDHALWLGYLQDYPDYWTQGQSLEDLESHLRDPYQDLVSGEILGVRKLADQSLRR